MLNIYTIVQNIGVSNILKTWSLICSPRLHLFD